MEIVFACEFMTRSNLLGVRMTPAAVIDGKVVLAGRVPIQSEMEKILYEIKHKGGG
ncbi:MAG: thioredoxin family protein [bacterium JZ-2024 1]